MLSGYMASHAKAHGGGGSNYLCLPEEPQWMNHGSQSGYPGRLYGVEWWLDGNHSNFFSTVNTGGRQLHLNPVPCALCYIPQRSTSVMMPATTSCPVGWTEEYRGYIMSDYSPLTLTSVRNPSSYICVDQMPEIGIGGTSQHQAHIVMVLVGCGTLPCSKYPNNWELACVVCSKWQSLVCLLLSPAVAGIGYGQFRRQLKTFTSAGLTDHGASWVFIWASENTRTYLLFTMGHAWDDKRWSMTHN